jgi:hypothetical protein
VNITNGHLQIAEGVTAYTQDRYFNVARGFNFIVITARNKSSGIRYNGQSKGGSPLDRQTSDIGGTIYDEGDASGVYGARAYNATGNIHCQGT